MNSEPGPPFPLFHGGSSEAVEVPAATRPLRLRLGKRNPPAALPLLKAARRGIATGGENETGEWGNGEPGSDGGSEKNMIEARQAGKKFQELVDILARLRGPDGCPWDRKQDIASIKNYFLEEVYEAVEAIDRDDPRAAAEELGDVLMEVVFLSRLFEERGAFSAADVLAGINAKMIRRHPHVFGGEKLETSDEVKNAWIVRKKAEKNRDSHFDGVPAAAPALHAAFEIGKRAADFGFDWPGAAGAIDKAREELSELDQAVASGGAGKQIEELGDCLFALACAARLLNIHPETALRRANAKFIARFDALESRLAENGTPLGEATLEEMEAAWQALKKERG